METQSTRSSDSTMATIYTMKELRELARKDKETQRRKVIEEKAQLIREIELRPAIWDRNSVAYRQKDLVDTMWDEVATNLQKDRQQCKKLWKNLVDHFREILATLHVTPSAGNQTDAPNVTWPYFEPMCFMKNYLEPKSAASGMCPESVLELTYSDAIDVQDDKPDLTREVPEVLLEDSGQGSHSLTEEPRSEQSPKVRPLTPCSPTLELPLKTGKVPRTQSKRPRICLDENLLQELKEVNRELNMAPTRSTVFSDYLSELLNEVPDHRRRQCEQVLLEVVNGYADGHEVVVAVTPAVT